MLDARMEARFRMWAERGGQLRLEPTERRVRAVLGGVTIVDSKHAQLLFLPPPFNTYVFPIGDVRSDSIKQAGEAGALPGLGPITRWTVEAGGKVAENAAWSAAQPPPGLEGLSGMVALQWNLMDHWYEEDDEVFVHPRDPYHRVDVLKSSRHVKVMVGAELVAETDQPRLLFETSLPVRYYIPRADIRMDLLEPTKTITRCPYKGTATYWSVRAGNTVHKDLAWSYEQPIVECPKIEKLIAFFNERVDVEVDGEHQERPHTPWSEAPPVEVAR